MIRPAALVIAVAAAIAGHSFAGDLPAFPGAEGPGANATGGRGKPVYHVTNLNSDGPGSLRDALSKDDRFIVFDVGGTIHLMPAGNKGWLRSSASNITIAGETAPGDGITVKGQCVKLTGHNVIVRNLKIRPGLDQARPGVATNDGITNYMQDSIIDHCSVSWADDEALSTSDTARNVTVQYCLIGESLNYHNHGFGALIASEHPDAPISYHHNLFSSVKSRLPRVGSEKGSGCILNFSNNIIYNWTSGQAGYSAFDVDDLKKGKKTPQPSRTNFLANYYIGGPDTKPTDPTFNAASKETVVWQQDDLSNFVDLDGNGTLDGKATGWGFFSGDFGRASARFPVESGYVETAPWAYDHVLQSAGAFWWQRDTIDKRIIEDTRKFRGKNIAYAEDVGGWIKEPETHRPPGFDTDNDGIPDSWEIAHGLDPKKDDHAESHDGSGYSNIELYCHELAAFPVPAPGQSALEFKAAAGRWEEPGNWEHRWKPSLYDNVAVGPGHAATIDKGIQQVATLVVLPGGSVTVRGGTLALTNLVVMPLAHFSIDGGTLQPTSWILPGFRRRPNDDVGGLNVTGNLDLSRSALRLRVPVGDRNDSITCTGTLTLGGPVEVVVPGGVPDGVDSMTVKFARAKQIVGRPASVTKGWLFGINKDGEAILRWHKPSPLAVGNVVDPLP